MFYKVSLFILITFVVTALLATLQQKINLDFDKIILPQLAPMIGGVIMILLFRDLQITIGLNFNRIIVLKSLLALVLPFFLLFISFFIGKLMDLEIERTTNLVPLFSVMITGILIGAIGEELGWRSFYNLF